MIEQNHSQREMTNNKYASKQTNRMNSIDSTRGRSSQAQNGHAATTENSVQNTRPSLVHIRTATADGCGNPANLLSEATTAVSSIDIQTLTFPDGSRGTFSTTEQNVTSDTPNYLGNSSPTNIQSRAESVINDGTSIMSYTPTMKAEGDLVSLLNESSKSHSAAWRLLSSQTEDIHPFEVAQHQDISLAGFESEFIELGKLSTGNEGSDSLVYTHMHC